jgi:hypothetical protein
LSHPRTYHEEKLENSLEQELIVAEHTAWKHLGQRENPVRAMHLAQILVHASVLAQQPGVLQPTEESKILQLESRIRGANTQQGVVIKPIAGLTFRQMDYLQSTCYPDDASVRFSDSSVYLVAE